jgi:hypothetical protein
MKELFISIHCLNCGTVCYPHFLGVILKGVQMKLVLLHTEFHM